jgi:hypothetical protein
MPKKISILVEGQTEEAFVKKILTPYYASKNIFLYPTIIKTKKVLRGPDHKGGVGSYQQVKRDLKLLFANSSIDLFTTMIDYYALPADFPGYNTRPNGNCYQRVEYVENEFGKDMNNIRFSPYLQLHEFESLVFANDSEFSNVFINQSKKIEEVKEILKVVNSPEEINEDPKTAPSKRLKKIFAEYDKFFHNLLILEKVKLSTLKEKCPHFNNWLAKIET